MKSYIRSNIQSRRKCDSDIEIDISKKFIITQFNVHNQRE